MTPALVRRATLVCASLVLLGVLATPALAQPSATAHYCESLNGTVIVQRGSARCTTDSTSHAKASGQKAKAEASHGGTAMATGNGSYAVADSGADVTATGAGSYAVGHAADASASGTNSRAQAVDPGSSAKAHGTNSHAVAVNGGLAEADGVKSFAHAGGTGSRATAAGNHSSATAYGNCTVYAGPGETRTCTG